MLQYQFPSVWKLQNGNPQTIYIKIQLLLLHISKLLLEKQVQTEQTQQAVDLSSILQHVVEKKCAALLPLPQLQITSVPSIAANAEKISNVFYHLISNAQQATEPEGRVIIEVSYAAETDAVTVTISDDGHGMSREFIEQRLFTPFDTTKGNAGMGIGAYDAKQYIEEIGGKLQVHSEERIGSTFSLMLPIYSL